MKNSFGETEGVDRKIAHHKAPAHRCHKIGISQDPTCTVCKKGNLTGYCLSA